MKKLKFQRRGPLVWFLVVLASGFAASAPLTAGAQNVSIKRRQVDNRILIKTVGELYGLDPELLEAISEVESGGDSAAVSPKGAMGLMQLMPATALRFMVEDPFDPVQNLLGSARFLESLRRRQASDAGHRFHLPDMIAAYNAGEGAVEKYGGIPPYPETRVYVRRVLARYLLGDSAPAPRQWREAASPTGKAGPHGKIPRPKSARPRSWARSPDASLLEQLARIGRDRDFAARTASGRARQAIDR